MYTKTFFKFYSKLADLKIYLNYKLNLNNLNFKYNNLLNKRFCHDYKFDINNILKLNENELDDLLNEKKKFLFKYYLGNRNFKSLDVSDFDSIIKNEQDRKIVSSILKQYEINKYDEGLVPSTLKIEDMLTLMKNENDTNQKMENYLVHLARKEITKIIDKEINQIRKFYISEKIRTKFLDCPERTGFFFNNEGKPFYGKWKNSFFLCLTKNDFRKIGLFNARTSAFFGQKIVFDFDFSHTMNGADLNSANIQLIYSYAHNFVLKDPFSIYFCNFKDEKFKNLIIKNLNLIDSPKFINMTEKSYLDIFPKEDLIYLTPNSPNILKSFNHNKIYIIGALSDKYSNNQYTYQKAIKEKITNYKLPLDNYIFLKGTKNLNINHVFKILSGLKQGENWKECLKKNVPSRKQKTDEEVAYEQNIKLNKYKKQLKYRTFEKKFDF